MFKVNHMFLMSSAINTKFGDFSVQGRKRQTLDTLKSVITRVPNAKIVIIESSGIPLDQATHDELKDRSHFFIDFSKEEEIQEIHNRNENWDLVKNLCEIVCFRKSLTALKEFGAFEGIHRVHKISGRYQMTDNFNPYLYEVVKKKIVLLRRKGTQYNEESDPKYKGKVEIPYQYMSRLWSWPMNLHDYVQSFYDYAYDEIVTRYQNDQFADIEHLLYSYLDPKYIHEVPTIGIRGVISGRYDEPIDE